MWENEALSKLIGNTAVRKNILSVFPALDLQNVLEMEEKCYLEIVEIVLPVYFSAKYL